MDEKFEKACFQIITYAGIARTYFINAIQYAKKGMYEEAEKLIGQGDEAFAIGHSNHADLLTMDMNGEICNGYLLLMHAEDQLMSAESFRIHAEEFIELYKRLDEK